MGHSAGLRAGTRVCERSQNWCWTALDRLGSISSGLLSAIDAALTGDIVCLLARLQEEGYDQALNLPETIQVNLDC